VFIFCDLNLAQKYIMKDKVCLITGATSGIGKATALALAKMGAMVIVNGKDKKKGEETVSEIRRISRNDNVHLMIADLSSLDEVRRLAIEFKEKYQKLDVLINNAGVFYSYHEYSQDGIEMQFAVNHLGHFLLTNLLLEILIHSPGWRIINVSSNAHYGGSINFADINFEKRYFGWKVYCQSKLANVLFTYELARRIGKKSVIVNCLHPGVVRTRFADKHVSLLYKIGWNFQKPFMSSVDEGAQTSIYLASSDEAAQVNGQYFVNCKPVASSELSYDVQLASKLWNVSAELVGLDFSQNQK